MNKAVPWNVNGVGFDAREAARDAARRQGKSLGEWLHGVIADHAADLGVDEHDIAGQDRINAVTSKLERLSTRSADHDRRMRAGRGRDFAPRRPRDQDEDMVDRDEPVRRSRSSGDSEPRRRRESLPVEATEFLLEEAVDAMERRALRAERHTDHALQSFTKLLERNEAHRDRERDSVTVMAQKLSDIERRLTDRLGQADENPIKGALARLEARLDTIGRRNAAETAARFQESVAAKPAIAAQEPFDRLEEKLNSLLQVVQARAPQPMPEVSSAAIVASQAAPAFAPVAATPMPAPKPRRLGEAIADISNRQQALQGAESGPISLQQAIMRRRSATAALRRDDRSSDAGPFAAMQAEIATLATTIENLRRDVAVQRQSLPDSTLDIGALRAEIAAMSKSMHDIAPRQIRDSDDDRCEIGGKLGSANRTTSATRPTARLQDTAQDVRDLIATPSPRIDRRVPAPRDQTASAAVPAFAQSELGALEALVRDLSQKIDAVQGPGADHQAFDALQQQVGLLSARFERSDDGLAKLTSLERSMRELFAHLDETRASVETAATRAAREVLRIAMDEGRTQADQGTATSLATIQALQDDAEARTSSTLSAVHGTLEKVVSRLAVMETDIAEARRRAPDAGASEARVPEDRRSQDRPSQDRPSNDRPAKGTPSPGRPRATDERPSDVRAQQAASMNGGTDAFLDRALGFRPGQATAKPPSAGGRVQAPVPDLDNDHSRADFIAAARRAAKVAQSDPSLADLNRSMGKNAASPSRVGLIEQSRDYVTRHKRPVLLSIAAIFVILGTMAIMQRIGLDEGDSRMADAVAAPTQVASLVAPTPQPARHNDELTPSALPTSAPPLANPIPGSDPIQTGSIPSLPAFAASAASRPRPALPNNLKAMAEAGDGAAEYFLAAQFAEGNVVPRDFSMAARWYEKAATQNLAPAQYRLASLYEKGLGVTQDKAKAKALYLQAAEAGNPRAMHNLAVLLADGDGKPDYDGAATWFRKAAQYGIHDSQYNLAILLARGIGVQQSLVQSYQWFAIAAAQGDTDAGKKRDEVATKLGANDLAVAKALAGSFHPRIADIAATEVQTPSS